MKVRVYKILKKSRVEGPKTRYCIWFQGCSKHCKGCWAKATWDFNAGKEIDVEEIIQDIKKMKNIDGITLLGGEPFEQAEALKYICENTKKLGLSVICFTGNKIEELRKTHNNILNYIDLLIDGEFIEEEKDYSRPWVGSRNQRYHFLTNKFSEEEIKQYKNKIEINIEKNGSIFMNGMGDFEKVIKELKMHTKH